LFNFLRALLLTVVVATGVAVASVAAAVVVAVSAVLVSIVAVAAAVAVGVEDGDDDVIVVGFAIVPDTATTVELSSSAEPLTAGVVCDQVVSVLSATVEDGGSRCPAVTVDLSVTAGLPVTTTFPVTVVAVAGGLVS